MPKKITKFRGQYEFLSNYCPASCKYEGLMFSNAEAAFQAAKTEDINIRRSMTQMPPNEAKAMGRRLQLREDWENIKTQVMFDICWSKFTENNCLGELLLKTGDAELIEGNTWGDTTWGVCKGVGENRLGIILMDIRAKLRGSDYSCS
jgi:ribA/ribD-fused uncharacterized protein